MSENKIDIHKLYASVLDKSEETNVPRSEKIKSCYSIGDGLCHGDNQYVFRCCCDLTILGCDSDWIERKRCENGQPVGSWERVENSDCTKFLIDYFQYGHKRINNTYVPLTEQEYLQLLQENENITEQTSPCRVVGVSPNAYCIGDCDREFQNCLLREVNGSFYCSCSA
ncbi:hypothetical protein H1P_850009 [Hyella patelloides LEGE 07179]|uniref:Uncharacterized protein n=1 Tax=Hyella patelloides LEGE 07179 TaxID=945734 RepID=A0A563W4M7_9CYAN|nr:hypothetical protein [Hyella patelloides]VEP18652.1 hypothetical protein H1P_850009 [Hyella patelloides LEGE 07179]